MLEIMLPNLVQAHIPVQPPVANVVQAPAGVQAVLPLVAQMQDLVVQHVAIVQPPVIMEVEENDNEILKRLFLQKFGRALPEVEVDVDLNMDLIDLTKDEDEMEVATSEAVVVVKTEPIDDRRRSSRLERRGLRKNDVIPDKEAPEVIADTDMAEDVSANPVGQVNAVESDNNVESEPLTAAEAFEMAEAAIAESDAAIAANQMVIDKFYEV
jgi:hypothetical protein